MKKKFWNRLFLVFAILFTFGIPVVTTINEQILNSELASQVFFECKASHAPNAYHPRSKEWNFCVEESNKYSDFNAPAVAKSFFKGAVFPGLFFGLLYGLIRFVVWIVRWIARGNE